MLIFDRVKFYCRIENSFQLDQTVIKIKDMPIKKTMYYYDFRESTRYFSKENKVSYLFGDVTEIPDQPTFVKSRPISDGNGNSVLLKLDRFRHYYIPKDRHDFSQKKPAAVWRGGINHPLRVLLVDKYHSSPACNIGHSHGCNIPGKAKSFMHPSEQMKYRYIVSIEGNDVASNLKWILASNSLCIMPRPRFETWFMESRLEAGEHYVEIGDDLEGLEDIVSFYERKPDEALRIIGNANRYSQQFQDKGSEKLISLLVFYKYFYLSGQLPDPGPFLNRLAV